MPERLQLPLGSTGPRDAPQKGPTCQGGGSVQASSHTTQPEKEDVSRSCDDVTQCCLAICGRGDVATSTTASVPEMAVATLDSVDVMV